MFLINQSTQASNKPSLTKSIPQEKNNIQIWNIITLQNEQNKNNCDKEEIIFKIRVIEDILIECLYFKDRDYHYYYYNQLKEKQ